MKKKSAAVRSIAVALQRTKEAGRLKQTDYTHYQGWLPCNQESLQASGLHNPSSIGRTKGSNMLPVQAGTHTCTNITVSYEQNPGRHTDSGQSVCR